MKKLLLLSVVLPLWAHAECNKPIDPKKVMLFVDTNYSDLEIATTEKAACDRGERLVVVPANYKEYSKYIASADGAQKAFEKCARKMSQNCEQESINARAKYDEMRNFTGNQKSIRTGLESAMKEIKTSGGKLKNISISGHDGGGIFGGFKGEFDRAELAAVIKDYSDINEVSALLLLGCYTGVQKEVYEWKNIFPNVRMIAGYDGSAPLSDKPFGHQYIRDVLLKEKDLLKLADEKKLQSYVKTNLQSMSQMHSALYLQCDDGTKQGDFYYGSEHKSEGFKKLDIAECLSKKPEMEEIVATFNKYNSGELEVPKDTANGELRKLYNQARRNEHCTEVTKIDLNVNGIFNLLFYAGVKDNYGNYYKEDLKRAEEILAEFDMEKFKANFEEYVREQEKVAEDFKAEIAACVDLETFSKFNKNKLEENTNLLNKLLTDPSYQTVEAKFDTDPKISEEDRGKALQILELRRAIRNSAYAQKAFEQDPEQYKTDRKYRLENIESDIRDKKLAFDKVKDKKIWVPTAANLKTKTRKETLENLSNMHGSLVVPGVPYKAHATMQWLLSNTANHLQYFENPFSWHEFTGQTEPPERESRLKDYIRTE